MSYAWFFFLTLAEHKKHWCIFLNIHELFLKTPIGILRDRTKTGKVLEGFISCAYIYALEPKSVNYDIKFKTIYFFLLNFRLNNITVL